MATSSDFRAIPKRKLSEAEKQIIALKIEKVRLSREKTSMILNKAVLLFFAFLGLGVLGLLTKNIEPIHLQILVGAGIFALIVGVIPYIFSAHGEEKEIEELLNELTG